MSTYLGLRSIDELVNYTYNRTPDEIMKAGFSTTDPGAGGNYNPLFGAMAWDGPRRPPPVQRRLFRAPERRQPGSCSKDDPAEVMPGGGS